MTRRCHGKGLAWGAALFFASGCAASEAGRYSLRSLELEGTSRVSSYAVRQCLISEERARFGIHLGVSEPSCGEPPFDASPVRIELWRWPWSDWPTFNRAVFDQDLERVLRFYRARGYYDAKIASVRFDPPGVGQAGAAGRCEAEPSECRVDIVVTVDEGQPTLVSDVVLEGSEDLPAAVQASLRAALSIAPGQPPDEAKHDRTKEALRRTLRAAGYAEAHVEGHVELDSVQHRARVSYHLEPGALYTLGRLEVSGQGALPTDVIEKAAALHSSQRFDPDALREIEGAVFALGAFSAVEVTERLDPERHQVDVLVKVSPLPHDALQVGFGVLSGTTQRQDTDEVQSIPQFDLHLFARYQQNQLLGTLGQLSVEDRPRLIFNAEFPSFKDPQPGNVLSVGVTQPGWPEARTNAFARASWDYGPDPYQGFFRSDLRLRVGTTRAFFGRHVTATLAAEQDVLAVGADPDNAAARGLLPTSYRYDFLEQELILDLRSAKIRPRSGAYLALLTSEAPRWAGSDWTALRFSPEARAFLPLPLDVVLAGRFALAGLVVTSANPRLDLLSQQLGPTDYRLRGGGANSNRGFTAGKLGVGTDGGIRRWESSLELRVPVGHDLVIAGFADAGDVSQGSSYRFGNLNTALGYGLRYYTVIGAIRLDVGYRIRAWQRIDGGATDESGTGTLPFSSVPGAVHLTIGDAF